MDRLYTAVDCGTTTCDVVHEVLETCVVYSEPAQPTALCVIPCEVSGCERQIYHYIDCAVWSCTEKTTPKPPVTTSSPAKPSECRSPVCISSVSINAIIGVAAVAVATFWLRRWHRRRVQSVNYANLVVESSRLLPVLPSAPPLPADAEGFQEVPLLARPDVTPPSTERVPLQAFESFRKFWSKKGKDASEQESSINSCVSPTYFPPVNPADNLSDKKLFTVSGGENLQIK